MTNFEMAIIFVVTTFSPCLICKRSRFIKIARNKTLKKSEIKKMVTTQTSVQVKQLQGPSIFRSISLRNNYA